MKWKITKDHIQTGREGYTRCDPGEKDLATPYPFRLFDDDGILYFEGEASEKEFGPLDWASYDSGCTSIQYLNGPGVWEQL